MLLPPHSLLPLPSLGLRSFYFCLSHPSSWNYRHVSPRPAPKNTFLNNIHTHLYTHIKNPHSLILSTAKNKNPHISEGPCVYGSTISMHKLLTCRHVRKHTQVLMHTCHSHYTHVLRHTHTDTHTHSSTTSHAWQLSHIHALNTHASLIYDHQWSLTVCMCV